MSIDVVDLRNFYTQRWESWRGGHRPWHRARFADTRGMKVVGVGYPTPYLGSFARSGRCLLHAGRCRAW